MSRQEAIFPAADQVPPALRGESWIGYKLEWNGHKHKKLPYSTTDGSAIGATAKYQGHFRPFDEALVGALRHGLDGVSYVVREGGGRVAVDFDNCRDPETGEIDPAVAAWLKWFPSYTEVSPSGKGVHVICGGKIAKALTATPIAKDSKATVEMYGWDRHLCFTGNRIGECTEITDCQVGIDKVLQTLGQAARDSEPADDNRRPMSKASARKLHRDNLEALRNAAQGEGNALLNTTAFFAARSFAAGALEQSEAQIRTELLRIVTREWKSPHDEVGALKTIDSGWDSGIEKPLAIFDGILIGPGAHTEARNAAEQALHEVGLKYFISASGEPVIPVYAETLQTKVTADDSGKLRLKVERDPKSVVIQVPSSATVFHDLDQHAIFQAPDGRGELKRISPPRQMYGDIIGHVRDEPRSVPFPLLDMVVHTPVLLPSGEIHAEAGFRDGVLFVSSGVKFPKVPESPSQAEARQALGAFEPIFEKFPFVGGGDWRRTAAFASVLAANLTITARPMLRVAVPMFVIRAPRQRSGKTKIAQASVIGMLGHHPTVVHFADEEEFDKTLLPVLRHQDRAILVDNVERPLRSSRLAMALTYNHVELRILGESTSLDVNNRSVFFATGNNICLQGDLAYRALLIEIDPNVERPEKRAFKFDPVARAARSHPQLVAAACTALRAYIVAGAPWGLRREPWGGFEAWDRLVSGCLTWLGYADPVLTRENVIEQDPDRERNVDLLQALNESYGDRAFSIGGIRKQPHTDAYDILCPDGHWDGYVVRRIMQRAEGRVEGGLKLVRVPGRGCFRVVKADPRDPRWKNAQAADNEARLAF
jgi:hypothetical protein